MDVALSVGNGGRGFLVVYQRPSPHQTGSQHPAGRSGDRRAITSCLALGLTALRIHSCGTGRSRRPLQLATERESGHAGGCAKRRRGQRPLLTLTGLQRVYRGPVAGEESEFLSAAPPRGLVNPSGSGSGNMGGIDRSLPLGRVGRGRKQGRRPGLMGYAGWVGPEGHEPAGAKPLRGGAACFPQKTVANYRLNKYRYYR